MYPTICIEYNNRVCDDKRCPKIHLCRRLVFRGICDALGCDFNHTLAPKDLESLRSYGLTQYTPKLLNLLRQFHLTYQNTVLDESMDSSFYDDSFCTSSLSESLNSAVVSQSGQDMDLRIFRIVQRRNRTTGSVWEEKTVRSFQYSKERSAYGVMRASSSRSKSPRKNFENKLSVLPTGPTRTISPHKVERALDVPAPRQRSASPKIIKNPNVYEKNMHWQICVNYINNNCELGTKCKFHHPRSKKIYQWVYRFDDELEWSGLDEKSEISLESAYNDPYTNEILNFSLLDSKGVKVNVRILFANEVVAESISGPIRDAQLYRLSLNEGDERNWVWYWLRDTKPPQWVPYGTLTAGVKSTIKSADIEAVYSKMQTDSSENIEFDVGSKIGFILNISKSSMYDEFPFSQEGPSGSITRVCRRPKRLELSEKHNSLRKEWPDTCSTHSTFPCVRKECPMFGFKGPYMWVACKLGDPKWSLLPVDVARNLEVLFSDPHICSASINFDECDYPLHFTRKGTVCAYENPEIRVERLCYDSEEWKWFLRRENTETASCVSKVSAFPEIASKLFSRLNDDLWIDFHPGNQYISKNANIEKLYRQFLLTNSNGNERINFSAMNIKSSTGKIALLCRRPAATEDIKSELSKARYVSIPESWVTKSGYRAWPIFPETSHEYRIIANFVLSKMPQTPQIEIRRIENHNLWKHYCVKRQSMLKRLGKSKLNEALLFHGTHPDNARKIAESNFDFRLAGDQFGTYFGHGTYFTPEFNYAFKWANATHREYSLDVIMVALVLCGESCLGKPYDKRPPVKPNSEDLYDSCVGDKTMPPQFVIFDHNQMYPMFAIAVHKRKIVKKIQVGAS